MYVVVYVERKDLICFSQKVSRCEKVIENFSFQIAWDNKPNL